MFADEAGNLTTFTCYAPPAMDSNPYYVAYNPARWLLCKCPVSETLVMVPVMLNVDPNQ